MVTRGPSTYIQRCVCGEWPEREFSRSTSECFIRCARCGLTVTGRSQSEVTIAWRNTQIAQTLPSCRCGARPAIRPCGRGSEVYCPSCGLTTGYVYKKMWLPSRWKEIIDEKPPAPRPKPKPAPVPIGTGNVPPSNRYQHLNPGEDFRVVRTVGLDPVVVRLWTWGPITELTAEAVRELVKDLTDALNRDEGDAGA